MISGLTAAIADQDPKGFLHTYLTAVKAGASLAVPSGLDHDRAKQGWVQIFVQLKLDDTGTFIDALTPYWLQLVTQQGGVINETFVDDLLAIMDGSSPSPPAEKSKSTPANSPSNVGSDSAPSAAPAPEISPTISPVYYKEQLIRNLPPLAEDERLSTITTAIATDNVGGFLTAYLEPSRRGTVLPVPKSTIQSAIASQWNTIIMRDFSDVPDSKFLHELTIAWHRFIHQFGIPVTASHLETIWVSLMKDIPPPTPVKLADPPTRPWWRKIMPF